MEDGRGSRGSKKGSPWEREAAEERESSITIFISISITLENEEDSGRSFKRRFWKEDSGRRQDRREEREN